MSVCLNQMHIPKTGGTALSHAMHPYGHRMGHSTTLEMMPLWPPIITVVRDPVERYLSAWGMVARQAHVKEFGQWPDASTAALDPAAWDWMTERWKWVFLPQTYWLRDAKYALKRCWYIARTETLDEDWLIVREALGMRGDMPPEGDRRRNSATSPRPALSPEAEAVVRERYAADYELLERL